MALNGTNIHNGRVKVVYPPGGSNVKGPGCIAPNPGRQDGPHPFWQMSGQGQVFQWRGTVTMPSNRLLDIACISVGIRGPQGAGA